MSRTGAWSALVLSLTLLAGGASQASAQTTWVAARDLKGAANICLDIDGNRIEYAALGPRDGVRCTLQGPRRLKLTSRYVFAATDGERVPYTLVVELEGQEVLRKRFTGQEQAAVAPCRGDLRIGQLRRAYVDLPDGSHTVTVRAESDGDGKVAVRLFRQVRRQRETWVAFAPERFAGVRHLQFESGNQSVYYQFTAEQPLQLTVIGPTTLRLSTRLDFDHTMNGGQVYALQVSIGGELWRTFHFDCIALTSALYVERPDILPGVRKNLRIPIPRGRHTVEVHCLRPDGCSVATMIHLPKRHVQR